MTHDSSNVLVPRYLNSIFADDLRQEIDGKITLVGVYQGMMIVPQFPTTLPKLAILMSAVTPLAQPFKRLSFNLLKDDELLQSLEIPEDALAKAILEADGKISDGIPTLEFQFGAILSPISFEEGSILRTRIETEDGVIAGRSLKVATPTNS